MQAKLIAQVVPSWWQHRTPALVTRTVTRVQSCLSGVELVTVGDDGLCVVVSKPPTALFGSYDGIFTALQGEIDSLER